MTDTPEWLREGEGHADIDLTRPLEIEGAPVSTMRMREPTVNDQVIASESKGSEAAREIAMFSNLCEVSPDDVRRLPLRDYKRLQRAFMGFTD